MKPTITLRQMTGGRSNCLNLKAHLVQVTNRQLITQLASHLDSNTKSRTLRAFAASAMQEYAAWRDGHRV